MSYQKEIIVCVPIKVGQEGALGRVLDEVQSGMRKGDPFPFEVFERVHFLRWVILHATTSQVTGRYFPASLVYAADVDVAGEEHLRELLTCAAEVMERIYKHCVGFPVGVVAGKSLRARQEEFLLSHRVMPGVYYEGHPRLSRAQIREDGELWKGLEETLGKSLSEGEAFSYTQLKQRLLKEGGEWSLLRRALNARCAVWAKRRTRCAELVLLGFVFFLVVPLLPVLLLSMAAIRLLEQDDDWQPVSGESTGATKREEMLSREDRVSQNQHTLVVEVKPGSLRLATLKVILFLVHLAGQLPLARRTLLQMSTLHFVSWTLIDNDQRLLFLSNYDGSAIKYVGDFVDRSRGIPLALTAIWSNTFGFPESRLLMFKGAKDQPKFLNFLREHQKHAHVWFSGYPTMTSWRICANRDLREGLPKRLDEIELKKWFQLI